MKNLSELHNSYNSGDKVADNITDNCQDLYKNNKNRIILAQNQDTMSKFIDVVRSCNVE